MATSVKQMLEAANANVPKITAEQAADMIAKRNALVVDVRDALEVARDLDKKIEDLLREAAA